MLTITTASASQARMAFKPFAASRTAPAGGTPRVAAQHKLAVPAKNLLGAGLGAALAAQLALAPLAMAGPDLPFGLNNPIGGDIERTREASKMPANRSDIGNSAAAQAKSDQAQDLSSEVGKATRGSLTQTPDEKQEIGTVSGRFVNKGD